MSRAASGRNERSDAANCKRQTHMRTLIGVVGYRNLRDFSAPFEVLDGLSPRDLGDDVVLEDISYNPIAVVQWLQGMSVEDRFDRAIFVSSLERGRAPGTVTAYRWDGDMPPDDQVQQSVTEAVTGIIALENTVVIGRYFKVLPLEVVLIEIEPRDHEFGPELSPPVRRAVDVACALVRRLALEPDAIDDLPLSPLPWRHTQRARAL